LIVNSIFYVILSLKLYKYVIDLKLCAQTVASRFLYSFGETIRIEFLMILQSKI